MTALRPEAAIEVVESLGAATDPKRSSVFERARAHAAAGNNASVKLLQTIGGAKVSAQ